MFAPACSPLMKSAKAWASTPLVRATLLSQPKESFRWKLKAHSKPLSCQILEHIRIYNQGSLPAAFSFGANMKSMNLFAQIATDFISKFVDCGVPSAEIDDKQVEI